MRYREDGSCHCGRDEGGRGSAFIPPRTWVDAGPLRSGCHARCGRGVNTALSAFNLYTVLQRSIRRAEQTPSRTAKPLMLLHQPFPLSNCAGWAGTCKARTEARSTPTFTSLNSVEDSTRGGYFRLDCPSTLPRPGCSTGDWFY